MAPPSPTYMFHDWHFSVAVSFRVGQQPTTFPLLRRRCKKGSMHQNRPALTIQTTTFDVKTSSKKFQCSPLCQVALHSFWMSALQISAVSFPVEDRQ